MSLLDVGVWLAAVWRQHAHHPDVKPWFDRQLGGLVMCRVAQMGLLRLLSNQKAMSRYVLSRRAAWSVIDDLRADPRVTWTDEPRALEPVWRAISAHDDNSHKLWTDDYLAAFAQSAGLTLVTLDKRIAGRYPSVRVETLI